MKRKIVVLLFVVFCAPCLCFFSACRQEAEGGQKYEITAEYLPENQALSATLKFTYENKTETVKDRLLFQLYPNAYRKDALYQPVSATYKSAAYYAGESYGEIAVTSVLGGRSWQVCGEDKNILAVQLETPLSWGDRVVLDVSFVTRLAKVNHRTGVSDVAVNLTNFYPVLCEDGEQGFVELPYYSVGDPFSSVCADYTVTLKIPAEYRVAATGDLVEERVLESKKTCTFKGESVRDFAMSFSTKFEVLESKIGKTKIRYYYVDDRKATQTLALIGEAVSYFSSAFGEYPYDTYTVVQTGFCLGGMEYPALTLVSRALQEEESQKAIVHETAHQWWYAAVGSDQVHQAWQDEGLTEYSTVLFFEKHPKYGFTREELVQESADACRGYREIYGGVLGQTDFRLSRALDEYPSDYAYRVLAYDEGVLLFDSLRRSVGDKKFFSALKKYYTAGKYRRVTVGEMVGAFEKIGVDVQGFFDAFLQGKTSV